MKYQSSMIRIILGLVFICFLTTPGACLDLGVEVLSEEVQISDTDPSGNFSMETDASQTLTITLDRDCTVVWYIDNTIMRTDTNTTTSSYYFTESTEGVYNVTVISRDSLTNATQVDFMWNVTIEGVPYEKKGEGSPYTPSYISPEEPVEPEEEEVGIIDLLPIYKWSLPSDFFLGENADKSMIGLLAAFFLLFIYKVKKDAPTKLGVGSKKKSVVVAAGKQNPKKASKAPPADPNRKEPSKTPVKSKKPENELVKSQTKHEPPKDSKKSVKPKKPENKLAKSQDKHEPTEGPVKPKKPTNKLSKSQDTHEPSDAPVKPKKSTNKLTKSQNSHEPSENPAKGPVKNSETASLKDMKKHIPMPKEK